MKTILIATIFVLVVIPIVIVFRRKKLSPKVANTVKKALNNLVPDEADPVSEDFGQPVQSVTDTDEGKTDKFRTPGTIATGDLIVKQLLPNGQVYKEHCLMENQIVPNGVSVSHPGAVTEGLCLTGVENEFHQFDMSEGSATYIAMTVPTDAIYIGKDADGYYAEVTTKKAIVYAINEATGKYEPVPNKEFIPITDGTSIRIGKQWLSFAIPTVNFPGLRSSRSTTANADEEIVPPTVNGVAERKITPRKRPSLSAPDSDMKIADHESFSPAKDEPQIVFPDGTGRIKRS